MRRIITLIALILVVRALPASGADNLPEAYARIKPAIVRVWVFNKQGIPIKSGSGLIVASANGSSTILTSDHIVEGGANVRIDVSRELRDLHAAVVATYKGVDLALLRIPVAGLHAATFASRSTVEGATVAAAGYGAAASDLAVEAGLAQVPQLLFPGTVSALPAAAGIIEISNIQVQPGMSGGPVFDPATGQVLGIIEARLPQRITVAISGPNIALFFLAAQHVRVLTAPTIGATAQPRRIALGTPAPRPSPTQAVPLPTMAPPAIPRIAHVTPTPRPDSISSACSHHTVARVTGDGNVVTTSDGISYRISNSYMEFRASEWTTGDAVRVCVSQLANGWTAASIANPARDFEVQAVPIGTVGTSTSPLSCSTHNIVRVAGDGSNVTTSDGATYQIPNSYMEFRASEWTTGQSVNVCLTRLANGTISAAIDNPAQDFKVQAELASRGSSASVSCRESRVFQVNGDGSTILTADGLAYQVANSYMRFRATEWTTGEGLRVCSSRLGDGSISASIKNPARDFTVEAIRR